MSLYTKYMEEIQTRKTELGLSPQPIDSAELVSEIINQIKDTNNEHRKDSLHFFILILYLEQPVLRALKHSF